MTMRWIEHKRHYRRYQARIAQLPPNYQTAVTALSRYLNYLGGPTDADSILAMLDDLADLLEQGAADGLTVRQLVGDDPVEFADAFIRNYPAGSWITRERDRLTEAFAGC